VVAHEVSTREVSCPTVRLAIHVGAVLVDSQAPDPASQVLAVGETLALPLRLLGQAGPGEIVVSPAMGHLMEGWITLEARLTRPPGGGSERIEAYAIVGEGMRRIPRTAHDRRARSRFVGRERELSTLQDLLATVMHGRGQVVGIVGELGVGKSRLLAEFRQSLHEQRLTYAEGRCLAYGSEVPYLPVLDLVREHCAITEIDAPEAIADRLGVSLQQVEMNPEEGLPYLLHLLGYQQRSTGWLD
jgi:AAA ATPase domain